MSSRSSPIPSAPACRELVRRHLVTAALLLAAGLAGLSSTTARADEYLLGPQDRVRLKIYEWRASRDAIFEWSALNDEFTVGPDGSLALPFVGRVPAAGQRPGALASVIAERLIFQMGLGQSPDVSLEVVQFRPFYIVGHVAQAGEFPYRPGLTVLQALSIAGGLRTREENAGRIEREVIAGRGDVSLLSLSHLGLLARRARLEAELAGSEEIVFPDALLGRVADGIATVLMQQERLIFAARREGMATQLDALEDLRRFLERETDSLGRQVGFLDLQIESVQSELGTVASLVEQGLAVAPRQLALERALLQVQSDRLSAETSLLRARQEISRTDIAILELRNRRETEVATDLRDAETQLNEIARRTDTALLLLNDSEAAAPRLLAMRRAEIRAEPIYTIVRRGESGPVEIAATEATPVFPGDTIKVEVPPLMLEDVTEAAGPASPVASSAPTTVTELRHGEGGIERPGPPSARP